MSAAEYSVQGNIAVIQLNHPPVNSLSLVLRQSLGPAIERAEADPAVHASIIIGSEKAFCGGADIREFGTDKAAQPPKLRDILAIMDSAKKPLVAAIGGFALGGGMELGLGCHYRVALPGTRLALPEITLGILAGGGGVQRMPRIIPVERAVEMCLSGAPIPVAEAHTLGLIDEVVEGDLLAGALRFTAKLVADGKGPRRIRDMAPKIADAKAFFDKKRAELQKSSRGRVAPLANLDALEYSVTHPFDESLTFTTEIFMKLLAGTESKALRHSFFAEREAAKIPDVPADTVLRDIKTAAVIGAGTMGGGIAMCLANAGVPVKIIEMKQEALDRGLATVKKNYAGTVAKGRLSQADMDKRMALISTALELNAAASADIIIEAVFEDMTVKQTVFKQLDAIAKPGAILATNTSTLDVDQIASATTRPQDVIGAHFFSPANVMRLLEVVRGEKTAKDVIATTMALGKKMGKVPVLSRVCDGFIGNRILGKYRVQAMLLLDEGASPQQIDRALMNWGLAMGPFAMGDLAGNDVSWLVRKYRATAGKHFTPDPLADLLCEKGRFGQKTGKGWYRYEPGNRTPLPDPEVEQMINDHRKGLGLTPRAISDEEIVERCLYAMANEGAWILDEGIALRASDIDAVYVNGYGFPSYRGGPMFNAEAVGLGKVLARIEEFAKGYRGDIWRPSALLGKRAAEGKNFSGT